MADVDEIILITKFLLRKTNAANRDVQYFLIAYLECLKPKV